MKTFRMIAAMAAAALAVSAEPALAHHAMGGATPATFLQGLLSGLAHPVIGLDHLAAVLAVGALAAFHRAGLALALAFVAAIALGAGLHLSAVTVPGAELITAASVVALGVLLFGGAASTPVLLAAFAAAGLVHGYVQAESIIGAEPTPLAAYLVGLALVQGALAIGTALAVRQLAAAGTPALRAAGAAVAAVGLVFGAQALAII